MPRGPRRTDLLVPKPEAVTTAPDQAYGNRTAQEQSEKMLPLGGPGLGPSTVPSSAPAPASAPAQPQPPAQRLPGDKGDWRRATERPQEVLGTGLPSGPGPGPEALTGFAAQGYRQSVDSNGSTADMLKLMAANPNASSVVKTLASNA